MIRRLIGILVCRYRGHRRGKFLRAEDNGRTKVFQCPRCTRETRYKLKEAV